MKFYLNRHRCPTSIFLGLSAALLAAGARLVQVHRALLGPSPRVASLLAGLGVPTAHHRSAAQAGG